MTDAELMKSVRKLFAQTQSEFAAAIGYSFDSVRSWEQGRLRPAEKVWRIVVECIVKRYSTAAPAENLIHEVNKRVHPADKVKRVGNKSKRGQP